MKITTLAERVAKLEGKKVEVNIAQIKEVIRCINAVLKDEGVNFYTIVRNT